MNIIIIEKYFLLFIFYSIGRWIMKEVVCSVAEKTAQKSKEVVNKTAEKVSDKAKKEKQL